MNKARTLDLRAMFNEQLPFPMGDARNKSVWRRLKKVYKTLSAADRDPDRLGHALAKAIAQSTSSLSSK